MNVVAATLAIGLVFDIESVLQTILSFVSVTVGLFVWLALSRRKLR